MRGQAENGRPAVAPGPPLPDSGKHALTGRPRAVLDAMARLCPAQPFGAVAAAPVNWAQRARLAPLAASAKLADWTLRALGARRLLRSLKDNPRVVGLVFRPLGAAALPVLSAEAAARLDRTTQRALPPSRRPASVSAKGSGSPADRPASRPPPDGAGHRAPILRGKTLDLVR